MAKLGFTKLNLKTNNEIVKIEFNNQIIEIKQYLSTEEKLDLITNVLELSHDQNNFSNPVKVKVYTLLEIIQSYTNIAFTEKQKENVLKLHDLIVGSGLDSIIINNIPEEEYDRLINAISMTIESYYNYRNSILGILDTISKDYSNLDLDVTELQKKLADSENLGLLKDIMVKMG